MKCRECHSVLMMPEDMVQCSGCGSIRDANLPLYVLLCICAIIMGGMSYLAYDEWTTTRTVEEWIPAHVEEVECLDWDTASAKYNISGEVLVEFMINQEC